MRREADGRPGRALLVSPERDAAERVPDQGPPHPPSLTPTIFPTLRSAVLQCSIESILHLQILLHSTACPILYCLLGKKGSSLTAQTTIATWIASWLELMLYTFSGDSMCSAKSAKPSTVSHCMQGNTA